MPNRHFVQIIALCALTAMLTGCQPEEDVMKPATSKLITDAKTAKDSGQADVAECRLKSALVLMPNSPEVLQNLAVTEAEQNQTSEAISHYEKALGLQANNIDVLYGLALAYQKTAQRVSKGTLGSKPTAGDLNDARLDWEKASGFAKQFLDKAKQDDTGRADMEAVIQEASSYTGQ